MSKEKIKEEVIEEFDMKAYYNDIDLAIEKTAKAIKKLPTMKRGGIDNAVWWRNLTAEIDGHFLMEDRTKEKMV